MTPERAASSVRDNLRCEAAGATADLCRPGPAGPRGGVGVPRRRAPATVADRSLKDKSTSVSGRNGSASLPATPSADDCGAPSATSSGATSADVELMCGATPVSFRPMRNLKDSLRSASSTRIAHELYLCHALLPAACTPTRPGSNGALSHAGHGGMGSGVGVGEEGRGGGTVRVRMQTGERESGH
jgi:hypothetical protein